MVEYIWSKKQLKKEVKKSLFCHFSSTFSVHWKMSMRCLCWIDSYFLLPQATCIPKNFYFTKSKYGMMEVNEQKLYHIGNEDVSNAHLTYAYIFACFQLVCASQSVTFASFGNVWKKILTKSFVHDFWWKKQQQ